MSELRKGAILSYIQICLSMMIALIYTPIIIRILGQSEFGLYSLIGSLAAYFSVMDLGLGNAMVRYTSRNRVVGDSDKEANLSGLFLILYSFIGILTVGIGIYVYNNIGNIFGNKLSLTEIDSAKIMIIILIINFSLSFPLSIFNSLMKAYERFATEKLISITRIILAPIIILPIIYMGYGAISMVLITTVVNIGALLYSAYYCFKRLKISISFGKLNPTLLKEILVYSFFVFLAVIVDQINWQTDQIILGAVKGTLTVAIYAIAIQFIKLYIQFSTSISNLFLPKASMMVARKASNDELTSMLIKYGRIQLIILTLVLNGFILFGKDFIALWAGEDYKTAYEIVLILMIPLTIPLVQNIGISILYAKNKQIFRSIVLVIMAIVNVVISIPIAHVYGSLGVALVTAGTIVVGNIIIMNIYYQVKIGLNMIKFWKSISNILILSILLLLLGLLLNKLLTAIGLLLFTIKVFVYASIHLLVIARYGVNDSEKQIIMSIKHKFK